VRRPIDLCVLISFIHNLGLTIKPIKGPPQGVYACPHNGQRQFGAVHHCTVEIFLGIGDERPIAAPHIPHPFPCLRCHMPRRGAHGRSPASKSQQPAAPRACVAAALASQQQNPSYQRAIFRLLCFPPAGPGIPCFDCWAQQAAGSRAGPARNSRPSREFRPQEFPAGLAAESGPAGGKHRSRKIALYQQLQPVRQRTA
jgi:hypothetical protein